VAVPLTQPVTAARADLPPRWPAVVRAELSARHARWLAGLADVPADRVLDLSVASGRQVLAAAIAAGAGGAPGGGAEARFDHVVSVAGLARFADLGAALSVVSALLDPAGVLWAVEPGYRPGPVGLVTSSVGALLPPARGVHLARDVPDTVRATGFTITDVRRFGLSTPVWPLRRFVSLRARPPGAEFEADVEADLDAGDDADADAGVAP